jgi:hypothetical protein
MGLDNLKNRNHNHFYHYYWLNSNYITLVERRDSAILDALLAACALFMLQSSSKRNAKELSRVKALSLKRNLFIYVD